MTESVGFGDAPVPSRPHPDRSRTDRPRTDWSRTDDPGVDPGHPDRRRAVSTPRVAVRYTLRAAAPETTPQPRTGRRERNRWATVTAWVLLAGGAGLSGVVAVVMLTAWSEMLVGAAASSDLVLVGGEHGLLLLAGTFLVLVAAMVKIWALGALVGSHHEAPLLLGSMLGLDLAMWAVGELGGGVGVFGCSGVVVIDVIVLLVLGLPWYRRRQAHREG